MLWYKAWLETRWRLLMPLAMLLFLVFTANSRGQLQLHQPSILAAIPFFWLLAPITLAGAGTKTEAPFRAVKGVSGSTCFTLSLPVTRLRLLAVRAGVGMVEWGAMVVVLCVAAWLLSSTLRNEVSAADGLAYTATVLAMGFAVFAYSTALSTFLDQQWQVVTATAIILVPRAMLSNISLKWDFFRTMGLDSPLITHTVPWLVIGGSFSFGLAAFLITAKIVERQQY